MITLNQWIELMKVLNDPNGLIHEHWFRNVRNDVMDFVAAHSPRLNTVNGVKEENGDYTLWLTPQLPSPQ